MPLQRKFKKADVARKGKVRETPEEEVAAAFRQWIDAVGSGNPDNVTKLYAGDAVLLPTLSPVVHDTAEKRRDYFSSFTARADLKGTVDESRIRVFGDIATNSGAYTFSFKDAAGEAQQVPARFSFVYRKEKGEWKIIEHHSSAAPAGSGPALQSVLASQDNKPADPVSPTRGKSL